MLSSTQITKSRAAREKEEANNNAKTGLKRIPKKVDEHKFEHYFSFNCCTKYLRSHQIMALNRGENQKVLSIKLQFKDNVKGDLYWFLKKEYLQEGTASRKRTELFEASFDEAFTKKCKCLYMWVRRLERFNKTFIAGKYTQGASDVGNAFLMFIILC